MSEILPPEIEDIFICLAPPDIAFASNELLSFGLLITFLAILASISVYISKRKNKYRFYLSIIILACIVFLSLFLVFYQVYQNKMTEYEEKCEGISL